MNGLRLLFLVFCLYSSSGMFVLSQTENKSEIENLNSAAFTALEENNPNCSAIANKLLQAATKENKPIFKINALTILGIINKEKGYYITALNHYLDALNASELAKDTARISSCYNNIGKIYQLQENFIKANQYYQKSLTIENSINSPLQKSIRLYNIGEVYYNMDSLDLALTNFNNSLIIEKNANNNEGIVFALLGITNVYLKIGRLIEADITLNKVEPLLDVTFIEETILYRIAKGKLYLKNLLNNKALVEYKLSEKLSIKNDFRVHLLVIYEGIINILSNQENWEEATFYYKKRTRLLEELNDIKVKNQLEDMTFQNELNKKNLEIELVQEERDLAKKNSKINEDISNYTTKIIWFLVFSIVLIITSIIIGLNQLDKK